MTIIITDEDVERLLPMRECIEAAAVSHAVHDPDAARQIETLGAAAEAMAPEDFRAYLEKEDAVWLPVVRNLSRSQ
jgi:tripartite-type tricarboxylate transporter receptor subunit TctC